MAHPSDTPDEASCFDPPAGLRRSGASAHGPVLSEKAGFAVFLATRPGKRASRIATEATEQASTKSPGDAKTKSAPAKIKKKLADVVINSPTTFATAERVRRHG